MNWHEAIDEMYKGNVVKYIGTVNGNVWTERGTSFCMQRGCIFVYRDGKVIPKSYGHMVYDPDFRYELTGETVDPRDWPNKPKKYPEVKVMTGYSRIGLGNV
jgi:hypothetical protein